MNSNLIIVFLILVIVGLVFFQIRSNPQPSEGLPQNQSEQVLNISAPQILNNTSNTSVIIARSNESSIQNETFPSQNVNSSSNSSSLIQNVSNQNQSIQNNSNNSSNHSFPIPRIIPVNPNPLTTPSPNLSSPSVSGPGIVYSKSSNFRVVVDGSPSIYDQVGVMLGFNEKAYPNNSTSLFVGDYPDSPPRDLIIHSRVTRNRNLENWRQQVVENGAVRKTVVISFLNSQGDEVQRITYRNAWPSKYYLKVTPDGFEEEVTIVSESVERD